MLRYNELVLLVGFLLSLELLLLALHRPLLISFLELHHLPLQRFDLNGVE